jgi:hypothetical protein
MALFFVSLSAFAQESPMSSWVFRSDVMLNGRYFWSDLPRDYAESWREQDGYAIVQGENLHYWLYDTVSYHNGNADEIYNRVMPKWVEEWGMSLTLII